MTLTDELELGERVALHLDDETRGVGSTFALAIAGRDVDSGEHPIPNLLDPGPITPRWAQRLDTILHWLATGLRPHPFHTPHPPRYPIPGPIPTPSPSPV